MGGGAGRSGGLRALRVDYPAELKHRFRVDDGRATVLGTGWRASCPMSAMAQLELSGMLMLIRCPRPPFPVVVKTEQLAWLRVHHTCCRSTMHGLTSSFSPFLRSSPGSRIAVQGHPGTRSILKARRAPVQGPRIGSDLFVENLVAGIRRTLISHPST